MMTTKIDKQTQLNKQNLMEIPIDNLQMIVIHIKMKKKESKNIKEKCRTKVRNNKIIHKVVKVNLQTYVCFDG
jgi:hypothetical protein